MIEIIKDLITIAFIYAFVMAGTFGLFYVHGEFKTKVPVTKMAYVNTVFFFLGSAFLFWLLLNT